MIKSHKTTDCTYESTEADLSSSEKIPIIECDKIPSAKTLKKCTE